MSTILSAFRSSHVTLRLTLSSSTSRLRWYCKDYSSSDDEAEDKASKDSKTSKSNDVKFDKESATSRLNRLLTSMQTDDTFKITTKLTMARPGDANRKRKEIAKEKETSRDAVAAAKRIASLLSDESKQKQTESELLSKLLGHNQQDDTTKDGNKNAFKNNHENDMNLSELIVSMKIDRRQQPKEQTRAEFVRRTLFQKSNEKQSSMYRSKNYDKRRQNDRRNEAASFTGSVNLFGSGTLDIFKNPSDLRDSPDMLKTWAYLQNHELKLKITHPPANYFEKIALWTEQGKVWRFPINNEQDIGEEAEVDFSEHIFLEEHLESWCPSKGPIRHFMELVCVGLSKNPYITAKEKKAHILWYRDYFESKKDVLKDLMSKEKINKSTPSRNLKSLDSGR